MILLSDGYLANGSEPWRLPDVAALPDISVPFATEKNHIDADGELEFWPYLRDPETLARPWAIPGTPGLMHRIGGIEKEDGTGNINYTPANHQRMVELRAAKVAGIAKDIPPLTIVGDARRRAAHRRLGIDVGRHRRRRAAPSPQRPQGGVGAPHATSTRCRAISATSCDASRRCSSPSSTRASSPASSAPTTSSTPSR